MKLKKKKLKYYVSATNENGMRYIKSIGEIADLYDYFLIDINGTVWKFDKEEEKGKKKIVLHNWISKTLDFLYNKQKKIIFFSNVRKTADEMKEEMLQYGVEPKFVDNIFTSIESLLFYIKNNIKPKSHKYYYIGEGNSYDFIDKYTQYKIANEDELENCDFVLTRGLEIPLEQKENFLNKLRRALETNKPIVSFNSDKKIKYCDSDKYAFNINDFVNENGFTKTKIINVGGKPYFYMYQQALDLYNIKNKNKVLAIGDKVHTDILGSQKFGIDCLFINDTFAKECQKDIDIENALKQKCFQYNISTPEFMMNKFIV